MCSGALRAVDERCNPLTKGVVDINAHIDPVRQLIPYNGGRIEGIRVILLERVFLRQVASGPDACYGARRDDGGCEGTRDCACDRDLELRRRRTKPVFEDRGIHGAEIVLERNVVVHSRSGREHRACPHDPRIDFRPEHDDRLCRAVVCSSARVGHDAPAEF